MNMLRVNSRAKSKFERKKVKKLENENKKEVDERVQ